MNHTGITNLEVPRDPTCPPKKCNDWLYVDDIQEIETHLQAHLQKHFAQAEETDFRQDPLRQDSDYSGSTATAEAILNGDHGFDESELHMATAMLLRHLAKDDVGPITTTMTPEQFDGKLLIKKWNERTTTSPSGVHLGHLKSYYATHSRDPDSEEGQAITNAQVKIKNAHLALLNYALEEGFAFARWNTIVNTLIPKDPGSSKIHRLRVIHLYEADYNLILGVKWRELLYHAQKHGLINKSQYGSVPGQSAIDLCFLEEMEYGFCWLTLHPLIKNDNDAASCYDRILLQMASIMSQKRGMPVQVCKVNGMNLEQAKYHIKTTLGTSVTFLTHTEEHPWHGSGQGAGNSPTLWLFISSTLFDCYEKEAHGATFATPDGSKHVTLFMTGFVDDTNSRTNAFLSGQRPLIEDLASKAEHDAQWWSDLLWASGGKLEPKKCNYHHIRYVCDQQTGTPNLMMGTSWTRPIDIKGRDGEITQIEALPADEDHKSLGCHKGPSGELQAQLKALQAKAEDTVRLVKSTHFTRQEAHM